MRACVRSVTLTGVLVGILSWQAVGPVPDPVAHAQAPASPRVVAIVGASVVDLKGGPPVADAVVIVEGDRINAVGPAASTPVPPAPK